MLVYLRCGRACANEIIFVIGVPSRAGNNYDLGLCET